MHDHAPAGCLPVLKSIVLLQDMLLAAPKACSVGMLQNVR